MLQSISNIIISIFTRTIMINYLSKYGNKSLLDATFMCYPPFYGKSSDILSKGFYWLVFGYFMTREIKNKNYLRFGFSQSSWLENI